MSNKERVLLNLLLRKGLILVVEEDEPVSAYYKALELGLIPKAFLRFEGKSYLIIGEQ